MEESWSHGKNDSILRWKGFITSESYVISELWLLSQNTTFSSQISVIIFLYMSPGLVITTNDINLCYDFKCKFSLANTDLIQYWKTWPLESEGLVKSFWQFSLLTVHFFLCSFSISRAKYFFSISKWHYSEYAGCVYFVSYINTQGIWLHV